MKLIKLYSLIIFSIISINVKAQSDTLPCHKFMLSFSTGLAIPFAEFARFEIDPNKFTTIITGVPKAGINLELNVAYYFNKKLGVYCKFNTTIYNTNPVDSFDLYHVPDLYLPAHGGGTDLISYDYNTNNWKTNELLIGILYRISDSNDIFNFKIALGVQRAVSPKAQLDETNEVWRIHEPNNYPYNYVYNSTQIQPQMISYNFVADIGIDWVYQLHNNFGMTFKLDCLVSQASFTGMSETTFNANDGTNQVQSTHTTNSSYKKNIDFITFGVGVYYYL